MNSKKKRYVCVWMIVCLILCLGGCSPIQKEQETKVEQVQKEEQETLYLILEHDTENKNFTLYSYADGEEYRCPYTESTLFKDKYDNITTSTNFSIGKVIELGKQDNAGNLLEVKSGSDVWTHENINRFSIDENRGVLTIGDTKYAITSQTMVFSNESRIAWADVSENDTLTVIGKEKKVLSVVVTKGQGTLALLHTEVFENSFLQLNTDIFAIITENMVMEVPEGKYTLNVANNGWGGSCDIEIVRGEVTTVDLEELKGEGYKKGLITFEANAENVTVKIDGKTVDISEPIELTYGVHSIVVEADEHAVWKKYLNVNSKEATIEIDLEKESEEKNTETTQDTEKDTEKESEKETENTEKESETTKDTEKVLEELLNELLQSNIITGNTSN